MKSESLISDLEAQPRWMFRAQVVLVHENGSVTIECEDPDEKQRVCDVLVTSEGNRLRLVPDDIVLAWIAPGQDQHGIIIGRVQGSAALATRNEERVADELVIEAKKHLTLRVGDGSITIRADGKILIKGKDLVSHAQRTNRIRGGSVAIN